MAWSGTLCWEHLALPLLQTCPPLKCQPRAPVVAFISPCTSLGTPASHLATSSFTEEGKR